MRTFSRMFTPVVLVLVGAILVLPLLNSPPWFSPPDWGKSVAFRLLLLFLFGWMCARALLFSRVKNLRMPAMRDAHSRRVVFSLCAVAFTYALSTLTSQDITNGFFGDPTRSGGLFSFLLYIAFPVLAFLLLLPRHWTLLWNVAFATGGVVTLFAFAQRLDIFGALIVSNVWRPGATLGGPIFLALYLLLLLFPAVALGFRSDSREAKVWYWGLALLYAAGIGITITRGAWIGLGGGIAWFAFFFPWKHRLLPLAKIVAVSVGIMGIALVAYVNINPSAFSTIPLVRTVVSRLQARDIVQSRFPGLLFAYKAVVAHPWKGYGLENASIGYDLAYDPTIGDVGTISAGGWWLDRAHNIILDTLAVSGIFGLLAYLSLLGSLYMGLHALKTRAVLARDKMFFHSLQAGLVAYVGANMFAFDSVSSFIIFFFFVGYILSFLSPQEPAAQRIRADSEQRRPPALAVGALGVISVGLLWVAWIWHVKPFRVNTFINVGTVLSERQKCAASFVAFERAIALKSTSLDAYARLTYSDALRFCQSNAKGEDAKKLLQRGVEIMRESAAIRPTYTRSWFILASFENLLADFERANPQVRQELLAEAHFALSKALELSPRRQEILRELVTTKIGRESYEEAMETARSCIALNPKYGPCWFAKGIVEIFLRQPDEMAQSMHTAQDNRFNTSSLPALVALGKAYFQTNDVARLAETYERIILLHKPVDTQFHAELAMLYKRLGRYGEARKTAERIKLFNPAASAEIDVFLRTLP